MSVNPREVLDQVIARFRARQIPFVIGASGLLYFLGLVETTGDWDILTDASRGAVEECLHGISFGAVGPRSPFFSDYLLQVHSLGFKVEIIGGFTVETPAGRIKIPAEQERVVQGIPLAKVDSWIQVYDLIGQKGKAELLRAWKSMNTV